MNPQVLIERIRKPRMFLLDIIKDVSIEQLNQIPVGFANNINWHLGHLMVAPLLICYLRAGLQPPVTENYIQLYRSGTKPGEPVSAEEAATIKQMLFSSLDQLEKDLQNNLFTNYPTWSTRYGVELTSIEDALQFVIFHEGLHVGYVTYMKRLVNVMVNG